VVGRSSSLVSLRPDLGVRSLWPAWRQAFSPAALREDFLAGASALGLAIPLALLTAQHTGISPVFVLITTVLASVLVAVLGGSTLGLSGPGVAMGFVLVEIATDFGASGVALACLVCGLLQLVLGVLGWGRFARLAPLGLVHGFAAGLGLLVVIQCLPYALGLATPAGLESSQAIDHVAANGYQVKLAGPVLAGLACAVTLLGARWWPRAPTGLVAIAVCALVTGVGDLDIERVPDLPIALPTPPSLALPGRIAQFALLAMLLFTLATLETLLSTAAEDEQAPGSRHDPDQELVGHGVTNLVLAFLGGAPATGSILRSRALRTAGGKTRAAAFWQGATSLVLVPSILVADRFIPLAALAGVVVAYALPLLSVGPLRAIWRVSRSQATVLAATALVIAFGNLLAGVETGLVLALVLAVVRIARSRATVHQGQDGAPHQVTFSGPLTFLSVLEIDRLRRSLTALDTEVGVILDMRNVQVIDVTGCDRLLDMVSELKARGGRWAFLGAGPSCRTMMLESDTRGLVAERLAVSDRDVDRVLGRERAFEMRANVLASLERFRTEVREHYDSLFEQLADGQHPHTLFVTCVDSRVSPGMLTGSHPGEIFIVRCLGAMVSPPGDDGLPSEGAAVEYAVGVLGVRNIVVCGHSQCGAVKAVKTGHVPDELVSLGRWLRKAPAAAGDLSTCADLDSAARAVTVRQLENLKQFPLVRERLAKHELELHAWFYDVGEAELYEWNESTGAFTVMGK
jgi:carbonic anhydrase